MRGETFAIALIAGVCVSASSAVAGPHPLAAKRAAAAQPGSPDGPDVITLSNNIAGDGSLVVNPDSFGSYTVWGWALNYDFYDPAGAAGVSSPMFASSLFIYAPATFDRIALGHPGQNLFLTYPSGTVVETITGPLAGSDSDGDGVIDTANSSFTVTGGTAALNLSCQLNQRVYKPGAGSTVARFRQRWTITNNAAAAANLKIVRHNDADLLWFGAAEDVAGSIDAPGCAPINPYQREPNPEPVTTGQAVAMVTNTPNGAYYAGRSGFDPDGAGPDPAMAYGTDFQIWNAYGLPNSWKNYTAGIGYAPTTGELPDAFPVGGLAPNDSFIGYQWEVNLPSGGSIIIDTTNVYGARTYFCYPDCNCDGVLTIADFGCFQSAFVAGNTYADCDGSGTLTIADFGCFQTKFVQACP